jgi:hypothetical protein
MHLGRLGASAKQREGDLGDPSCGCGRELVLVDMNLSLWSPSCGSCDYHLVELVAVVAVVMTSFGGQDLLIVVMIF